MLQLGACALLATFSRLVSATHCITGFPVLLGSNTKDGNTQISTWAQTPQEDHILIAGTSNSADFTERS